MRFTRFVSAVAGAATLVAGAAHAQTIDSATIAALRWRNVGSANTMGRIADVEGIPWPSRTLYVAAAGGGLWKSTNFGTTFRPIFENYGIAAMGDLAIAPSDTNTLYLGTGEPNSRNSMSPGGGVFKSTDGGMSWKYIGLRETEHIGRILVHPTNPQVAWVAALGPAWRAGGTGGLYKTTDGGETWTKVLKPLNDETGVVDVAMHPTNPNVLLASTYQRQRGAYFLNSGGAGSSLWRSEDGGTTWTEVTGNGFPATKKGRINIAFAPSDGNIVYTMVEADSVRGAKPQELLSGLYRSADGGKSWERTAKDNTRPFYYNQVRVHPTNPNRVWFSSTPVKVSDEGGRNARNATVGVHVDHHAMWIDPKDPQRHVIGNDGGIAISHDNGGNYVVPNVIAVGQPYNVSFDYAVPYNICGGLQDNGSWCGPSRRRQGTMTNSMWFTFNGGDGFVTAQDPTDSDIIYGESQGGNIGRYQVSTGQRVALQKPNYRPQYMTWEDSIMTVRGDTTKPATTAQTRLIAELRAKQKADSSALQLRWNWNTPFFISAHNPQTLYFGSNRVMKSTRRGDDMYPISGDLSYADTMKIRVSTRTTGGITTDATGAETYGTIVSLNESTIRPGYLFAGTDDGRVWTTANDGGSWTEVTANIKGVPAGTYVSRIEPSHFDINTFYVTYDNHRRGDFTPYVFATADGGKSFRSIAAGLPQGGPGQPNFVHVIREDLKNRNLLFVGTDIGAYVSGDRGTTWQPFMTGLPNVPVHDLQIHPRENELIAATHGRMFWIVDITPLQQMTSTVAAATLFAPRTGFQWGERAYNGESTGNMIFEAQSPAYGADIWYRVTQGGGPARLVIQDAKGDTVQTLTGMGTPGLHRVTWNYQGRPAPRAALTGAALRDSINQARRQVRVLDSIVAADSTMKPTVERIRTALAGGAAAMQNMARQMMGGAGGAGGGPGGMAGGPQRWNDRPAEQAVPAGGQGGGGGGGGRGGMNPAALAQAAGIDQDKAFAVIQALGIMGGGGGGGGGAFGGVPMANTGDYLVTLKVGDQTLKQVLRVERRSGGEGSGMPFEVEAFIKAYEAWLELQP